MAGCCETEVKFEGESRAYRRVLWMVIAINGSMFVVEMLAGVTSHSKALQADALDFIGDTATYAISLYVIGQALKVRATAAMIKGLALAVLGLWVLASTIYRVFYLGVPDAATMGIVGAMAFVANAVSALLLLRFRDGDANVRSVWLCSRNDAIGNLAVILAASGVWSLSSGWPDLAVAGIMASLFLHSATRILRQAWGELRAAGIDETQRAG